MMIHIDPTLYHGAPARTEGRLPRELAPHVACLDFIIGPQLTYFNNCSVISWGGLTRINLIRSLRQPELERRFLTKLVALGLEVTVDSNQGRE